GRSHASGHCCCSGELSDRHARLSSASHERPASRGMYPRRTRPDGPVVSQPPGFRLFWGSCMTALPSALSALHETMPDVATPALTAPLIGRESEIGALRDAWARALDGDAGAVVLAGDAGIGKTRLVTEL